MTAPINLLAEAVAAELNDPGNDLESGAPVEWSQEFDDAAVKWRIRQDLEKFPAEKWAVDVVQSRQRTEVATRGEDSEEIDIKVAVYKKADPDDSAEMKPIFNLLEEFRHYWLRRQPVAAGVTDFTCMATEVPQMWVPDELEQNRVCITVLTLTFARET